MQEIKPVKRRWNEFVKITDPIELEYCIQEYIDGKFYGRLHRSFNEDYYDIESPHKDFKRESDELTSNEKNLVSVYLKILTNDRFLEFFSDDKSVFHIENKVKDGTYPYHYPPIMLQFKDMVMVCIKTIGAVIGIRKHNFWLPYGVPTIWQLEEKYCNNKERVYLDDLMDNIELFTASEILFLLYYFTWYKERYFTGAFGSYAEEGFIGMLLKRLKGLINRPTSDGFWSDYN